MFNRTSAVTASRTLRTECRHFDYACCIAKYVDSAALQGLETLIKKKKNNTQTSMYISNYVKTKIPFLIRS